MSYLRLSVVVWSVLASVSLADQFTFFVNSNMSDDVRQDFGSKLLGLLASNNLQAGDTLSVVELPLHKIVVANYVIPEGAPNDRIKDPSLAGTIKRIKPLIIEETSSIHLHSDFTRIPETLRALDDGDESTRNVVVVLATPIYRSIEKDNEHWDFLRESEAEEGVKLFIPAGGALKGQTPFSVGSKMPKNSRVYWIAEAPKWSTNRHMSGIANFFGCYFSGCGAEFVGIRTSVAATFDEFFESREVPNWQLPREDFVGMLDVSAKPVAKPQPKPAANEEAQPDSDSEGSEILPAVVEHEDSVAVEPSIRVEPARSWAKGLSVSSIAIPFQGLLAKLTSVQEGTMEWRKRLEVAFPVSTTPAKPQIPISAPKLFVPSDYEAALKWFHVARDDPRYAAVIVTWKTSADVDLNLHVSLGDEEVSTELPRASERRGGLLFGEHADEQFELIAIRDFNPEDLKVSLNKFSGGPVLCEVRWVVGGSEGQRLVSLSSPTGDFAADVEKRGPSLNWFEVSLSEADCACGQYQ